ncbi:hypothetical protein JXL83_00020 [candidate division WOR-3 bacterium]|nr:hypothetical protein [candidate division WOR-3 bacterium]
MLLPSALLFFVTIHGLNPTDSTYAIKSLGESYPEFFEPDYDTAGLIQCTALLKEVYPTQKRRQSFVFTFEVIEGMADSMTYDGMISVELWNDAAACFMESMEFEEAEEDTIRPSFYGLLFPENDIHLVLKLHEKYNPRDYYLEDAVLIKEPDQIR